MTGAVAQICQMNSVMKTNQALVKAIVLGSATARTTTTPANTNQIAMSQEYGAGILDAHAARYIVNSQRYRATPLTSGVNTFSTTFTVTASDDTTRVALVWLKNNRFSGGSHVLYPTNAACAEMELKVTAPNGTIYRSFRTNSNVQIVHFKPPVTGTYTIQVTRITGTADKTHMALAYY